jgi:flagellar protein FlbD
MIKLTRLNGQEFVINAELIELIEAKPDTIVTLTTGEKYITRENVDEIISKVRSYKQSINLPRTRE